MTEAGVFVYDIDYRLDPDETRRRRRVSVADPRPEPGYGPALGVIHRALRDSDSVEFGRITDPAEVVILSMRQVVEGEES